MPKASKEKKPDAPTAEVSHEHTEKPHVAVKAPEQASFLPAEEESCCCCEEDMEKDYLLRIVTIVGLFVISFSVLIASVSVIKAVNNNTDNILYELEEKEQLSPYNGQYQAVFLNNNQVYFCKLAELNDEYVWCADVYYLKVKEEEDDKGDVQQKLNLTKLGQTELHQPTQNLRIRKDTILFIEDIRPDAEILTAIKNLEELEQGSTETPTDPAAPADTPLSAPLQ